MKLASRIHYDADACIKVQISYSTTFVIGKVIKLQSLTDNS